MLAHLLRIIVLTTVTLFCFPAFAHVPGLSCMDLFADCRDAKNFLYSDFSGKMSDTQIASSSMCVGYLRGFSDAGAGAFYPHPDATNHSYVQPICVPQEVTAAQLTLVFVSWAEQHSNMLNLDGASCLLVALAEGFPCQPENRSR